MKVSIILPTYNEKGNIKALILSIRKYLKNFNYEMVVVDDNSPDGTADIVKNLAKKYDNIKLIIRKKERGLASAIGRGIKESKGDVIVAMDTDLSHPPEYIPQLLKNLKGFDLVVASRYVKGGKMISNNRLQIFLSKILNFTIRFLLGLNVRDVTGGFFAIKKKLFKNIDVDSIFKYYGDYFFELLYELEKNKVKSKEIPFTYKPRQYGESKTKIFKAGLLYLREVFKIRARESNILSGILNVSSKVKLVRWFFEKYEIWEND